MVIIRLKRGGKKNKPFYTIVVTEKKVSRNGKFIEKIGYFDLQIKNANEKIKLTLDKERLDFWITKGAQITKRIKALIKNNSC